MKCIYEGCVCVGREIAGAWLARDCRRKRKECAMQMWDAGQGVACYMLVDFDVLGASAERVLAPRTAGTISFPRCMEARRYSKPAAPTAYLFVEGRLNMDLHFAAFDSTDRTCRSVRPPPEDSVTFKRAQS